MSNHMVRSSWPYHTHLFLSIKMWKHHNNLFPVVRMQWWSSLKSTVFLVFVAKLFHCTYNFKVLVTLWGEKGSFALIIAFNTAAWFRIMIAIANSSTARSYRSYFILTCWTGSNECLTRQGCRIWNFVVHILTSLNRPNIAVCHSSLGNFFFHNQFLFIWRMSCDKHPCE